LHDVNRHSDRIRAHCLVLEQPIAGEALDRWLQELLRLKGPDLLRSRPSSMSRSYRGRSCCMACSM